MIHKPFNSRESLSPESSQGVLTRQVRKFLLLVLVSGASVTTSCASIPIVVEPQSCNARTKCTLPPDFPEVKMEKLKFLIPAKENYADEKKMPAGFSADQRPPLWPCDRPDHGKPTPSLVIEAAKQAKSFLDQIDSRHRERLNQLTLLSKILESTRISMNSRGNTMRSSDKGLSSAQKIHRDNLKATQNLVPNWDRFLGRATELQAEIDQLVQLENEAGKKSGQCAKAQDPLTSQKLSASIPESRAGNIGDFEDYKGVLPELAPLAPYICANAQINDSGQVDFELFQWLNFLEHVLGEHMGAALKRETAYIFIQDKENGSDPNENLREDNQVVLAQSRCLMDKTRKLKEEVLKAIQKDTETAEKLKRCERVE